MEKEIGQRIQILRKRCGMSIRQLADQASVTAGIISCIERGKNSPSITTLQKILSALGTDLPAFFANGSAAQQGPVFVREHMQTISDGQRNYTIVFAKSPQIGVEMFDEHIYPGDPLPELETLKCDVAGYIVSGALMLEIEGEPKRALRPGDAFYISRGKVHRGWAHGDEPARLITVYYPAGY